MNYCDGAGQPGLVDCDEDSGQCIYCLVADLEAEKESANKHWENESNNVQVMLGELIKIKAENESLREQLEDADEQVVALEKQVKSLLRERYAGSNFRPGKNSPAMGYTGCIICGVYTDHGGLQCPQMRATARNDLPDTRSGQIGCSIMTPQP